MLLLYPRKILRNILSHMHMCMVGVVMTCSMTGVSAQSVKLAWNANPETNIGGYIIYYGTESGNLTESTDVGNQTTTTLEGLSQGVTHYAAVQAYNTLGQFSDLSAEISFIPRIKVPALVKNQSGATQPDVGSTLDFGVVRLGALGETQTYTLTNTGTTALTGLRFEIEGAVAGNFLVGGIPVTPLFFRNNSFEDGLANWTSTGNIVSNTIGSATNGSKIAQFSAYNRPNTGVISQSFTTIPGVTYRLAFDAGVYWFNNLNTDPQKLRTTIRGQQTLFSDDYTFNFQDSTLNFSDNGSGSIGWTARTLEFTADSTSTKVTFTDISSSTNNVDVVIDHVRMIDLSAPPKSTGPQIATLAPGESATITLAFRPNSDGKRQAVLRLMADNVSMVLYEVNVVGTGSIQLDAWLAEKGIQDGPAGNPDMDVLANLQEYAFGTDPKSSLTGSVAVGDGQVVARGTPSARVLAPEDGGFQGLFARRKDHASVNLRYIPQFSADLIQWVDATALPVPVGDDGEMEVVSVNAPDTINGMPARFFRVGVEQVRAPNFAEWLASTQATSGTNGNPDGDALNNLQEFAFGTDPLTAGGSNVNEVGGLIASRGAPSVRVIYSPDPQLHGMFGRRKEHAAAGLVYVPQFSANLETWVDADAAPVILADDGEMEIVSVAAPPTIDGQPVRFFRVGVDYIGLAVPIDARSDDNQTSVDPESPPPGMLLEYAFGIDGGLNGTPRVVEESDGIMISRGFPAARVVTTPDLAFQGLFCRRIGHAALGLTYRPQFSADLDTWEDATEIPVVLTDDGEIEVVSVSAPATINGQPARFFRVGVEHQP